jgi:tetratricopeptide (TPR) repeat protein
MNLGDELVQLRAAWRADAPEVVVFHETRILEFMARGVCQVRLGSSSLNLYSNIESLRSSGQFAATLALKMHGLRRLGNEARHVIRTLSGLDALLSTLWTLDSLHWLARHPELASTVLTDPHSLGASIEAHTTRLAEAAPQLGVAISPSTIDEALHSLDAFHDQPAAELAMLEWLADRIEPQALLPLAATRAIAYPLLTRFRQLSALALSRMGDLDAAEKQIAACIAIDADAEALGILGGILKRRWLRDGERAALTRALDAYRRAWQDSASSNTYAGINVAALALWSGDAEEARRIARTVLDVLDHAEAQIHGATPLPIGDRYWIELTRLEALVLTQDLDSAKQVRQTLLQPGRCPPGLLAIADAQIGKHIEVITGADCARLG